MDICEQAGDKASRDLLVDILKGEEKHLERLEGYKRLIKDMGLPNFLQAMI